MTNHLARRGGLWWARLVVPLHLRQQAGRREFCQSTQTHELHIAKLVTAVLVATWRRQLLALEPVAMNFDVLKLVDQSPALIAGGHLSIAEAAMSIGVENKQLIHLAANGELELFARLGSTHGTVVALNSLELDDFELGPSGGRVIPQPNDMPADATPAVLRGLMRLSDDAMVANAIIAEALDEVMILSFHADMPGSIFIPNFKPCIKVNALQVSALQVNEIRQRLASELTSDQIRRAQEESLARLTKGNRLASEHASRLFSEALNAYCSDASGLPRDLSSASEQKQRKKGCMLFLEFMGDLPLSEIDSEKLRTFRDGPLRTLPAKVNNLPKGLRRATMKETVEALRIDAIDWPIMSLDMQRERMLWLGRFFAWLKAKEWIKNNPADSLQGETGLTKAERKDIDRTTSDDEGRGPFGKDVLQLIFGQSWFISGSGAHFRKPRKWYPFEYWLPLLGLYAGCRIGEASQLHLTDVKGLGADSWYLDINEATKDKSLKNEQSRRIVPLHQALIDLGFIDYCERLKLEGFKRVFPELTYAKSDARYAKEPIRKMSIMFKALGMPRDGLHVFHCLRHNMNNGLARIPMENLPFADEGLKKFIRYTVLGHKPGDDVNVKHYTSATPEEKLTLVRGLHYELPHIARLNIDFAIGQIRAALANKDGKRSGVEDMGPLNK